MPVFESTYNLVAASEPETGVARLLIFCEFMDNVPLGITILSKLVVFK